MLIGKLKLAKLNRTIGFYRAQSYRGNWSGKVKNYEEFKASFPATDRDSMRAAVAHLHESDLVRNCLHLQTSGSTGVPLSFPVRNRTNLQKDCLQMTVFRHAATYVFAEGDVVANLFAPGNFSNLYEGFHKMLEYLPVCQIPIGRMTFDESKTSMFLETLLELKVNTLIGTPSSLVQIARMCQKHRVHLPITKIVYTGEAIGKSKRTYFETLWPSLRIFSFFGTTELGFVGFSLPSCTDGHFHLFDEWFVFESESETNELLVTDLNQSLVPFFRYKTGDVAVPAAGPCSCGLDSPQIKFVGRSNGSFNFMGNLVHFFEVEAVVQAVFGRPIDIQIQISCVDGTVDHLTVVVDLTKEEVAQKREAFVNELVKNPKFAEALEKRTGELDVASREVFFLNDRQKIPRLKDQR